MPILVTLQPQQVSRLVSLATEIVSQYWTAPSTTAVYESVSEEESFVEEKNTQLDRDPKYDPKLSPKKKSNKGGRKRKLINCQVQFLTIVLKKALHTAPDQKSIINI